MKNEIISKFKEKPRTKTAWWAMWLGLSTVLGGPMLLGIYTAVIRPIIDITISENAGQIIGFGSMIVALISLISALVLGIVAFRKGERSWVLWLGFIPAILAGVFWIFMIIGEFIFPH